MLPSCSNWAVWKGVEIEGEESLGVETLFVRRNFTHNSEKDLTIATQFKRIWFTRDFKNLACIEYFLDRGYEVAVEIEYSRLYSLTDNIKAKAKLYVVLDWDLPAGTHIKSGEGFKEKIGILKSPSYSFSDYEKDEVIKE